MRRIRLRRPATWLALLALGSFWAAEGAKGLAIRFAWPPPHRPVSGETRVALEVNLPAGTRLVRIDLFIDDQLMAAFEKPPFEVVWNAGPEFLPHRLRAVATDNTGSSVTALLETPPLRIGQRESVALVNLFVNAFDAKGRGITDLRREEFRVLEDGVPQEISHFTGARQPLSVALLLDASNSMGTGQRMEIARKAAVDFIRKMDSSDRLLVMSFSDKVREIQLLARDRKLLE